MSRRNFNTIALAALAAAIGAAISAGGCRGERLELPCGTP